MREDASPGAAGRWRTDPFTATVLDGKLYGRGAVDMKGGVACMLEAVAALRELDVPLSGDVVFATVVDEEIGGMGALALVDRGWRADAAIRPRRSDAGAPAERDGAGGGPGGDDEGYGVGDPPLARLSSGRIRIAATTSQGRDARASTGVTHLQLAAPTPSA